MLIEKDNKLRISESVIMQHNFTEIKLTGSVEERKITVIYYDSNGNEIWKYEIERE
jgi:hypothetical protein